VTDSNETVPPLRTYSVNPAARGPLVEFMERALTEAGCRIVRSSRHDRAPFSLAFETASGERMGVLAYAFLITRTPTKNRPEDEWSFQIKYGGKLSYANQNLHDLWQDPLGMFTTVLIGVDPKNGFCVSADPFIHSPTKFFIRLEFKDAHANAISRDGWHVWQRIKRNSALGTARVETLVGARRERFLDLIRFERAAHGLDPGNRLILGEEHAFSLPTSRITEGRGSSEEMKVAKIHPLVQLFELSSDQILDLIAGARRLKMAVRGWVAEEHLRATLLEVPGITHCERLDAEGGPDLRVSYRHGPLLSVECKNVARETDKNGNPKIDFQRTRAAKGNPCSRYYRATDFDVVAGCLHAVTSQWDFRFVLPSDLPPHKSCPGRITSNIRVGKDWVENAEEIFRQAYAAKGRPL
jgi:hypothetical protein